MKDKNLSLLWPGLNGLEHDINNEWKWISVDFEVK